MENGKGKWCSYHNINSHSDKDCYQQQSESANLNIKKIWCTYHNSASHLNYDCFHQRGSKNENNSSVDGKSIGRQKTFIADSAPTGCGANFCCKYKGENNSHESNGESYSPPPGRFSFAMCHSSLSHQIDGFQLSIDSRSPKHFIDPELMRRVESRLLEYTRLEPPKEIRAAADNVLLGTAQGILLVEVRGTGNV